MTTLYFDLSQRIEEGMSFFPGDPEPHVMPAAEVQAPWQVSDLRLGSHTGTHIDAPRHYVTGGRSIDQYGPRRFILEGIVIPALGLSDNQAIVREMLERYLPLIPKGGAVLLHTGWDQYWKTEQYASHPYLTRDAAQELKTAGVSLLGIDALNVDSTTDGTSDVHDALLGSDVLIVENLKGLSQLEPMRLYMFSFLPLLISGSDGSPVRAVAWENQ